MDDIILLIKNNFNSFLYFFFIIGACFGSFFNVVILRFPEILKSDNAKEVSQWFEELGLVIPEKIKELSKDYSVSFPASHCYSCHTPLKWYHNIPIFSYLFLRGKCGFCGIPITIQYPLVEFSTAILLTTVYYFTFLISPQHFLFYSLFFVLTYLLLLVDLKTMFLPDKINYMLLWLGLIGHSFFSLSSVVNFGLKDAILAIVLGYGIMATIAIIGKIVKGVDAMGGGDLKLVAALAPFVGVKGIIFVVFGAPFFGIFFYLIGMIINKTKGKEQSPMIPYGPSLILASWLFIVFGSQMKFIPI